MMGLDFGTCLALEGRLLTFVWDLIGVCSSTGIMALLRCVALLAYMREWGRLK